MSSIFKSLCQMKDPSIQTLAHAEAEKRAKFVRGMGSSLVGYCDGYADGFEHAVMWLLGEMPNPLVLEYRPASGMGYLKDYYKYRPQERTRILKLFEEMGAGPSVTK